MATTKKSQAQLSLEAKMLARINEYIAQGRPLPRDLAMAAAILRLDPECPKHGDAT